MAETEMARDRGCPETEPGTYVSQAQGQPQGHLRPSQGHLRAISGHRHSEGCTTKDVGETEVATETEPGTYVSRAQVATSAHIQSTLNVAASEDDQEPSCPSFSSGI